MGCDVIRDLIPLYEEDLCSKASRELVEAHVAECADCRGLMDDGAMTAKRIMKSERGPGQHVQGSKDEELKKKELRPFRKVKRTYNLMILAAFLLIPLLVLGYGEVTGNSLLRAAKGIYRTDQYFDALVAGDHARAVRNLEFTGGRYGQAGVPLPDAAQRYVQALQELEEAGIRFTGFDATPEAYGGMRNDDGFTSGYVEVTAEWQGKSHNLLFWVSAQGKKIDVGRVEAPGEGEGTQKLVELLDRLLVTYFPG